MSKCSQTGLKSREKSQKHLSRVEILNVAIDNVTQALALEKIEAMLKEERFHLVVTPYSEYIIDAQKDTELMTTLNNADLSLPDGIFILWAATFNSYPVSRFFLFRLLQLIFRFFFLGLCIVFYPKFVRRVIQERVSGSDLIYPLSEMCAKKGYSVFFLGGFDWGKGNSGVLAAQRLAELYPGLKIAGIYPGEQKEESLEEAQKLVNSVKPDLLLICINRGRGEKWAYRFRNQLKCKVAIGLGGTFDFVSGYTSRPPSKVSKLGLEWFFRPFSRQYGGLPGNLRRVYRVWRGVLKSSIMVFLAKLKEG